MILSKSDYFHYLERDRIAMGRKLPTLRSKIISIFLEDYIWKFLRLLRKIEYYKNVKARSSFLHRLMYYILKRRFRILSLKLGFSIPENVFGPGLAIPHYGTIVVNANAKVGANCRIHVSTNIGASAGSVKAPRLGDNIYLAPGVKIYGDIYIASNTAISANSVVNKSVTEENNLLAGAPAKVIKKIDIRTIIKNIS
jgi:serine O-acetyltransferase